METPKKTTYGTVLQVAVAPNEKWHENKGNKGNGMGSGKGKGMGMGMMGKGKGKGKTALMAG